MFLKRRITMKKLVSVRISPLVLVAILLIAVIGVCLVNALPSRQADVPHEFTYAEDANSWSWLTDYLVNDPDDGTRDWITTPIRNGDLDELIEYLNEQRNLST